MILLFRSGTYVELMPHPLCLPAYLYFDLGIPRGSISLFPRSKPANLTHSFRQKIKLVLNATRLHARNLATFAVIYKLSMIVLRNINPADVGKEGRYDSFFAGLLGGYAVFGRQRGSISQQVCFFFPFQKHSCFIFYLWDTFIVFWRAKLMSVRVFRS